MDLKTAYTEAFEKGEASRRKTFESCVADLPTFPVEPARVSVSGMDTPWIEFPYDRALMPKITAALNEQGWTMSYEITEAEVRSDYSSPRQSWYKGTRWVGANIEVVYSDQVEGAKCVRREIGKRTEERPVYEFACADVNDSPLFE